MLAAVCRFILESERSWILFLQEAYDPITGWNPEMLRKDQQLASMN